MKYADLFKRLAANAAPSRRGANEVDVAVDLKNQRVAGTIASLVGETTTYRVQTDRAWSWSGTVKVPDSSTGTRHDLLCQVSADGTVAAGGEGARAALRPYVAAGFDADAMFGRCLDGAIFAAARQRTFLMVDALCDEAERRTIEAQLADALRVLGLAVDQVRLRPQAGSAEPANTHPTVDLDDGGTPLEIRARGDLTRRRLDFKAVLEWDKTSAGRVGRLTYRGSTLGTVPGAALAQPLVGGQIQPVEAWFRRLLVEALAEEDWSTLLERNHSRQEVVKDRVSDILARGTGRRIRSLVLLPVVTAPPGLKLRDSFAFVDTYPISGVHGEESLAIEHRCTFRITDVDRWRTQGKANPQAFLQEGIGEATRESLRDYTFAKIIGLYVRGADGDQTLGQTITAAMRPVIAGYGIELVQVSTLIKLPEMDFLERRRVVVPERVYKMGEVDGAPLLTVIADVRVGRSEEAGNRFARKLSTKPPFAERVEHVIAEAMEKVLQRFSTFDYYCSSHIKGIAVSPGNDAADATAPVSTLDSELFFHVAAKLLDELGLELQDLALQAASGDPVIRRMTAVKNLTKNYPLSFEIGDSDDPVTVTGEADIFVSGAHHGCWGVFYSQVGRTSEEEHVEQIKSHIGSSLKVIYNYFGANRIGLLGNPAVRKQMVVDIESEAARKSGLRIVLDPLVLSARRRIDTYPLDVALERAQLVLAGLSKQMIERTIGNASVLGAGHDDLDERLRSAEKEYERVSSARRAQGSDQVNLAISQNKVSGMIERSEASGPGIEPGAPPEDGA